MKLKRAITDIVPLQQADWDNNFVLIPDTSNWAVGAALQQERPNGALRPLAFFSSNLSGSKLNWSTREKECYAIVAALLQWHCWVGNRRVEVSTDHGSLKDRATKELKTVGGPSPRQARWHELFCKFDLYVVCTWARKPPRVISCPVGRKLLTRRSAMCPYMGRPKRTGLRGT